MEQKINCTVSNCEYNENHKKKCKLDSIIVTPNKTTKTHNPDESMCSSYHFEK
jgi:Domain of Unknown Function (DUF1540).